MCCRQSFHKAIEKEQVYKSKRQVYLQKEKTSVNEYIFKRKINIRKNYEIVYVRRLTTILEHSTNRNYRVPEMPKKKQNDNINKKSED